jgi:DNA-binding NtrC family response regulator
MARRLSILVLDDEPIVGRRLQPALEKDGHEVEIFEDGRSALARLRERTFDIVVTDVRMDDIDGIEVLETVQEMSRRTRVILITGYATVELAREAIAKGAFDFIAKPFKPNELRKVIDKAAASLRSDPVEA